MRIHCSSISGILEIFLVAAMYLEFFAILRASLDWLVVMWRTHRVEPSIVIISRRGKYLVPVLVLQLLSVRGDSRVRHGDARGVLFLVLRIPGIADIVVIHCSAICGFGNWEEVYKIKQFECPF